MIHLGTAKIESNKVLIAGSYQTVVYTFTAGHAIDDTGYVKIVFRYAGDFGTPQFSDPGKPNFCAVSTNGNCRVEPRWDAKGHTRPWGKALYLKVMGGFLNEGEKITVIFGDTGQGSPGWRIQTFCEATFECKTFVDPFATYQFKEIEDSPTLSIIPGKPVKAVCIAPSQILAGEPYSVYLRLEDRWGNAVGTAREYIQRAPEKVSRESDPITVCLTDEGTGLAAESNPIHVTAEKMELSQFWADFHGQSEETIGSNTIEEYFLYARDNAKLDIAAHQGNDFQISDEFWDTINCTTAKFYDPGKFVTYPGFEWSGNTPLGGDRNIYFRNEGEAISRSSHDLLPDGTSKHSASPTAGELFSKLDPDTSFAFAHVGGRYADVTMHNENIEVAMEIHSAWGTFEWLVQDALKLNYRIGICANSDGHKGRPGASYPGASKFGSYGGLTCILAPALERDSVFSALHKRHFFATTGHRPLFSVIVKEDGGIGIMGEVVERNAEKMEIAITYQGTAPVEYAEIYRGSEVVDVVFPNNLSDSGNRVKIVWSGAERRGRDRQVIWDGTLHLSENRIERVLPVNFWNADKQPKLIDAHTVSWESITTGGVSGVILELDQANGGVLDINSLQAELSCKLDDITMQHTRFPLGGLDKKITVNRLAPPQFTDRSLTAVSYIKRSEKKEDPVFVKVVQEDGHMTWSSPIYILN